MGITDAPIDEAKSVVIPVKSIEVKKEGAEDSEENWLDYFNAETEDEERTIDLLQFSNGEVSLFDEQEFEPGSYGQMRIYLANGEGKNTITLDDDSTHELDLMRV